MKNESRVVMGYEYSDGFRMYTCYWIYYKNHNTEILESRIQNVMNWSLNFSIFSFEVSPQLRFDQHLFRHVYLSIRK